MFFPLLLWLTLLSNPPSSLAVIKIYETSWFLYGVLYARVYLAATRFLSDRPLMQILGAAGLELLAYAATRSFTYMTYYGLYLPVGLEGLASLLSLVLDPTARVLWGRRMIDVYRGGPASDLLGSVSEGSTTVSAPEL